MAPADIRRHHEALDWVRRIHDPAFDGWDEHIAWLEASPGNSAIFDAVSLDVEAATAGLAPASDPPPREAMAETANDNVTQPGRPAWRRFAPAIGFGIAAAAVGIVSLPSLVGRAPHRVSFRTMAGEQRVVRLPDGTRLALNGDTQVDIDAADSRVATVAHGEALFAVVHDGRHPFTVHAGDAVFQDVGTVFDVVRTDTRAEVAVREGAVLFDPEGSKLRVDAGHALRLAGGGDATLRTIAPQGVGGWKSGRLTYADVPVDDVAQDIARATGRPVSVDIAARARRFSGVIVLDKDEAGLARRVSAATGLAMRPDGTGWRMALPER